MPAKERIRHKEGKYEGVYYIESKAIGSNKKDRIYYIVYRKDGRLIEEKAGRAVKDSMTWSRASSMRSRRIEGKEPTNKERRELEKVKKEAEQKIYTIDKLWKAYKEANPNLKGMHTYQSLYNLHIKQYFSNKEPKDLFPLDIQRIKNKLLKKRSPQTVQHVLEQLRRIINFGVRNQLCEGLNFKIEMPKVDNIKTEDLTPTQLDSLLKAIEKDDHPHAGSMMKMVLFTGMRRSELFRLKWKHINFERGFIDIVDPKGGQDQKIPLNDEARRLLESHQRKKSPYVFPGRGGGQMVNVGKAVNKIKKEAELPKDFRPLHGLRHVYASMLASSGKVDLYVLQKLLTHKDASMTLRYAHLRDEALKNASDLAGDLIADAIGNDEKKNVVELKDPKK